MADASEVLMIAKVCHEANRAYCQAIGDDTQRPWAEADEWQRESALEGVCYSLSCPDGPCGDQHAAWVDDKVKDGWVYGEIKDAGKKTHPCIVPYEELPVEQQKKDALFKAIVAALGS